jgi:hypothetical protein
MKKAHPSRRSHLFTIRCWEEDLGVDGTEWRSRVHHIQSGEVRYFRVWTDLIDWIKYILETKGQEKG